MPLRLNVGVSKKLGLPAYSSVGASCHLEVELENGILRDPAGFRDQVQGAFLAAQRAVDDELDRLQGQSSPDQPHEIVSANGHSNGHHLANGKPPTRPEPRFDRPGKPATPNQVKAIVSIARRQHADLDGLLGDLGVSRPEDLSLSAASRLIDQLKAAGA